MLSSGMTIREATERWVHEMNAFPYDMIDKLMSADIDRWHEVTTPTLGDRVYVYELPEGCEEHGGEIENYLAEADVYLINLDDGTAVEVGADAFEVERDYTLPMWGTMWSFGDSADDYWLEEMGGIDLMSQCGFRIYESEDFGYIFGIDGAGYDFYESHWVPLYKARGLQWHDPMTESGSFVMKEWRKADLYNGLLGYLSEMVGSKDELVDILKKIGFTDHEIAFEGLEENENAEH